MKCVDRANPESLGRLALRIRDDPPVGCDLEFTVVNLSEATTGCLTLDLPNLLTLEGDHPDTQIRPLASQTLNPINDDACFTSSRLASSAAFGSFQTRDIDPHRGIFPHGI